MFYKVRKKWRSWRVKKASRFGRFEHWAGRVMQYPYLAILAYGVYSKSYLLIGLSLAGIWFWAVYIFSHTVEKKLYGRFGPRG